MESSIGKTLTSHNGDVSTTDALNVPLVGLYFSASWCPPCRQFTPLLAQAYGDDWNGDSKRIEIIFVTFDREEKAFKDYYGHHPWLAIPWSEGATRKELATTYKIQGIPALIILDKSGKLITDEGVEALYENGPSVIETWLGKKQAQQICPSQ
eukprot:TRINITY_DN5036_c0_g1_i3.p1 TRINITY_DN5036_c0_g1~~TRINITY_DN5036_c0_g1_i3.p1  ORF type:complete len:153 (-),score=41.60 TRINITY_DN5036_c0_g1_i3:235-693(-)